MNAWVYYAYNFLLVGKLVETPALGVTMAAVFHVLFIICMWSFAYTTLKGVAPIPRDFYVSDVERQRLELLKDFEERWRYLGELGDNRGILTLGPENCVRYCDVCGLIKPDRCHHCSVCKRCIPRMDHHCPWFNNCVSFTNLKAFLLTLLYSSLLAGYTALTGGIHAVIAWISLGLSLVSVQVTILVAGGTYLSTALATFLFVHLDQLSRNLTSLESSRMTVFQESGDSFDLGWSENFVQVFGRVKLLWPFPVLTSLGDGSRFPTKLHPDPAKLQLPLVREHELPRRTTAAWATIPVPPGDLNMPSPYQYQYNSTDYITPAPEIEPLTPTTYFCPTKRAPPGTVADYPRQVLRAIDVEEKNETNKISP
ncbi:palmitoyltransferase ZDHHC15B-like [Haemaphysalis longicornis]